MDKNIRKLFLFNIIFYLNNFVLIILTNTIGLKDIVAFWFFSPFVLILFTTSMLESIKGNLFGQLKKLSVLDFLLRCLVLVINFFVISGIIDFTFNYLIILGIIFMSVNVYLEWKMYTQIRLIHLQNKIFDDGLLTKKEIDDLCEDYASDQTILMYKSLGEKEEIRNIYNSTFFVGSSYVLIFLLIGIGIFAFNFFGKENRIFILIFAFLLLGIYFYLTNKKLTIFFKDHIYRKKINLRDNFTFFIGLSIIYILQGFIHIGTGTFNFLGIFFAILFLTPTMKTNYLIRDEFHKINKKYMDG